MRKTQAERILERIEHLEVRRDPPKKKYKERKPVPVPELNILIRRCKDFPKVPCCKNHCHLPENRFYDLQVVDLQDETIGLFCCLKEYHLRHLKKRRVGIRPRANRAPVVQRGRSLTDDQVREIRKKFVFVKAKELAKEYDVSIPHIHNIVNGKRRTSVQDKPAEDSNVL